MCEIVWIEEFCVELLGWEAEPPVEQLNGIEGHVLFIFSHAQQS